MTKTYSVVEVFSTFQGEGKWTGRRAVFLRLAGCNLWSGLPEGRDKGQGACARWCDTAFAEGHKQTVEEITTRLEAAWGGHPYGRGPVDSRMVVVTGGEPTLQLDVELASAIKAAGWYLAVETNGTRAAPALALADHVCVSPKKGSTLAVMKAHELKVVLPGCVAGDVQDCWKPAELRALAEDGDWGMLFVQPQDVTEPKTVEKTYLHAIRLGATRADLPVASLLYEGSVRACLDWCRDNPGWRVSVQVHKTLGLR